MGCSYATSSKMRLDLPAECVASLFGGKKSKILVCAIELPLRRLTARPYLCPGCRICVV